MDIAFFLKLFLTLIGAWVYVEIVKYSQRNLLTYYYDGKKHPGQMTAIILGSLVWPITYTFLLVLGGVIILVRKIKKRRKR